MATNPFHLAWFISKGYGPKGWRQSWGGPDPQNWVKPDLLVHLAKELERAAFDYVMIEDSCNIPYTYKNSHETYLRYAIEFTEARSLGAGAVHDPGHVAHRHRHHSVHH